MLGAILRAAPSSCYVVAASPRTGSALLCEGLAATGVAGSPAEFLSSQHRPILCERLGLPINADFASYLEAILRGGTTPNGVFGCKIHWLQLAVLAKESGAELLGDAVLCRLFHEAKYIHLTRRDRLAQAISFYRAFQTDVWWRVEGVEYPRNTPPEPPFDAAWIRAYEKHLAGQRRAWEQFFALNRIEPLTMEYETLVEDYRGEVARALRFLGLDPTPAMVIPNPRLLRQADAKTEEWRRALEDGAEGK